MDAAYAFGIGNNQTLVFEGMYRSDHYPEDVTGNDKIEDQYQIGVHYLYSLGGVGPNSGSSSVGSTGSGLMIGGFAAYGAAPHRDSSGNENYKVVFGGFEAIYIVNNDFTVLAQFTKRMRSWYILHEFKEIANANG